MPNNIEDNPAPHEPGPRPRVTWWLLGLILVAGMTATGVIRRLPNLSDQHVVMDMGKAVGATLSLMLIWLMFWSGLPWRVRFGVLGVLVAVIAMVAAVFRIRGVTGNLVPILEPRWVQRAYESPSTAPVPANSAVIPGLADFPQFLGPSRNGVLPGPKLGTNWATQPPKLLWRRAVGTAWSGFVVSGAKAVTQEQRGEEEFTVCYDVQTGTPLWSHAVRARYFTTLGGEGPRATATISGGKVYSQGATGVLSCLDLNSGKEIWSRDVLKTNGAGVPGWGFSSSPLVLDDWVVVNAGGSGDRALVAYSAKTGKEAWHGGNAGGSYCSPFVASLGGTRQIIVFSGSVVGHDATSGRELWQFAWPGGHPHVAMPVIVGGTDLIVSSGYGTGSARIRMLQLPDGKWNVEPVWRVNRMKAKFANPVLHDGYLYGLDDGILACQDVASGELKWKDGRYGHGQTLLVGTRLLVMAESGEVVLVDPVPEGLRELAKFAALNGKTWNPHCLAGEFLLVRNDKEAACFRLPTE